MTDSPPEPAQTSQQVGPDATAIVSGVDFISIPTQDLERAVDFYGNTLGLPRSAYRPERNFAEFETGTVTLNVANLEKMGVGSLAELVQLTLGFSLMDASGPDR